MLPSFWIHGTRKQLQLQLQLLREALGELVLPEVFRPVPFLGQYQQTVVGKVRQGTWRITNQLCGRSLMYIHCVWKEDKERKNGVEFTILHFLCQRSRPQGTVSCSTFGGVQGSSILWLLFTYAGLEEGKKDEGRMWVWSKNSIDFFMWQKWCGNNEDNFFFPLLDF